VDKATEMRILQGIDYPACSYSSFADQLNFGTSLMGNLEWLGRQLGNISLAHRERWKKKKLGTLTSKHILASTFQAERLGQLDCNSSQAYRPHTSFGMMLLHYPSSSLGSRLVGYQCLKGNNNLWGIDRIC
jgi:hypothetical protein